MFLRIARWQLTFLAGILLGMGLVLHGQVAVAHHLRNEVENTFPLWRGIGRMTFFLQDDTKRTSLVIHEMPAEWIDETDRFGWVLVAMGGILAVTALLIRRRSGRAERTSRRSAPPARA